MTPHDQLAAAGEFEIALDRGDPELFRLAEDFVEDTSYHRAWMSPSQFLLAQLDADDLLTRQSRSGRDMHHLPAVPLGDPSLPDGLSAWLRARRSATTFASASAISLGELSSVLWAAFGVNAPPAGSQAAPLPRHTAPTAGGLASFDLHVLVDQVAGVRPGHYLFDPHRHCLREVSGSFDSGEFAAAFPHRDDLAGFCACFVYVFSTGRLAFKYGSRGWRFGFVDAGHSAQNALLAATAIGLASRPVGGFYDRDLAASLDVDGVDEVPVHAVFLGRR
jgi:SagB-type dehydrogenase family enzyme